MKPPVVPVWEPLDSEKIGHLLNFGHAILGKDGVDQIFEAMPRACAMAPALPGPVASVLLAAGAAVNFVAVQIEAVILATGGDPAKPPEWAVKLILAMGLAPNSPALQGPIATDEELRTRAAIHDIKIVRS